MQFKPRRLTILAAGLAVAAGAGLTIGFGGAGPSAAGPAAAQIAAPAASVASRPATASATATVAANVPTGSASASEGPSATPSMVATHSAPRAVWYKVELSGTYTAPHSKTTYPVVLGLSSDGLQRLIVPAPCQSVQYLGTATCDIVLTVKLSVGAHGAVQIQATTVVVETWAPGKPGGPYVHGCIVPGGISAKKLMQTYTLRPFGHERFRLSSSGHTFRLVAHLKKVQDPEPIQWCA